MPETKRKSKSVAAKLAAFLRSRGFDKSYVDDGVVRIRCSQCNPLVIQYVPCHERGCPNEKKGKS